MKATTRMIRVTAEAHRDLAKLASDLGVSMTAAVTLATTSLRRHGVKVLEDACQSVGGSYRGRRLASLGDAGAYSFNQFKVIACGEGALAVSELQKAGGKRLPVQQFLAGHPLQPGDRFSGRD